MKNLCESDKVIVSESSDPIGVNDSIVIRKCR